MPIFAYQIVKLETKTIPSFEIYSGVEIMNLLGHIIYRQLDENCIGYFELDRKSLQEALAKARGEEARNDLRNMLESMEDKQDKLALVAR